MKVAVTGASGFVGSHLVDRLLRDGHEVTVLSHSQRGRVRLDERVRVVSGSVEDPEALTALCAGNEVVFHLVGIIAETRTKTFEKTVVHATRALVGAALRAKVLKVIYLSAIGASANSATKYYRSKFEAEQAIRLSGLNYTILRPSIIFGEGDGFVSMLTRMIRLLPFTPVIGSGRYRLQPVYVDDVTSALAQCVTMEETSTEIIDLAGPERLEYLEILHIIKRVLNKRRVNIHLPLMLMKMAAAVMEKILKPAPLTKDQLTMLVGESVGEIDKMRRLFGIEPVGFENGLSKYLR
ncbi:MAG TPA: complex I NDUFA9 subunit family protein [candidate division Zixibacteria bacterium]|nr:complex I NDUFA9 subunit family protein [candidate division Zixibacteria bacterium]